MTDPQHAPGMPRTRSYALVAVVAGAVFAVIALLQVPGIWYAVVGVLLGLYYAVLAVTHRNSGQGRQRNRNRR